MGHLGRRFRLAHGVGEGRPEGGGVAHDGQLRRHEVLDGCARRTGDPVGERVVEHGVDRPVGQADEPIGRRVGHGGDCRSRVAVDVVEESGEVAHVQGIDAGGRGLEGYRPAVVDDRGARGAEPGAYDGVSLPPLMAVQETVLATDISLLEVVTVQGVIPCIRHGGLGDGEAALAVFVGGALGGLSGPAGGLYQRVAERTGGIRLHYRRPGDLDACVADVVLLADQLLRRGASAVVLVGHSFGGAVAVAAGVALGAHCAGVVTLATQAPGCERVDELTAPILCIHGEADAILPDLASRLVHDLAGGPKELLLLPDEGHLLSGAAALLDERVTAFVTAALGSAASAGADTDS